ncbi:hypothetical protein ES708_06284 [subsurface metagenome]
MEKTILKSHLGIAIILGSVWGFAEAALGMGLRSCAALVSGSLMTGVALFFISAGWVATRRFFVPILIVLIACFFKLFDALLLSLPVKHGAIANPIFALLMEGLAFLILVAFFNKNRWQKKSARALLGGGTALIAISLFPLVKFATGIPACIFPGTLVPLSIFFSPVAVVLSAFTVPLGFLAGEKIRSTAVNFEMVIKRKTLRDMLSPATLVLCMVLLAVIRLILTQDMS